LERFDNERTLQMSHSGEGVVKEQEMGFRGAGGSTMRDFVENDLDTCQEVSKGRGKEKKEKKKKEKKKKASRALMPIQQTASRSMTVQEKGNSAVKYLFRKIAGELRSDWNHIHHFDGTDFDLPWGRTEREENAFFYLGRAGSGLSMHQHTAAYNAMIFGHKRWYLLPPSAPKIPEVLSWENFDLDFYEQRHSELPVKPIVFDQFPGEVVFVPTEWQHAVINIEVSVGISVHMGKNCGDRPECTSGS